MRNLADIVAPAVPRTERSEATRALQCACRTLNITSPDVVRSIQVTLDVDDLPVSRASAWDFVQRIAMEYGVEACASAGEKQITILLARNMAPQSRPTTKTPNEVRGWVSRFFSWLSF